MGKSMLMHFHLIFLCMHDCDLAQKCESITWFCCDDSQLICKKKEKKKSLNGSSFSTHFLCTNRRNDIIYEWNRLKHQHRKLLSVQCTFCVWAVCLVWRFNATEKWNFTLVIDKYLPKWIILIWLIIYLCSIESEHENTKTNTRYFSSIWT